MMYCMPSSGSRRCSRSGSKAGARAASCRVHARRPSKSGRSLAVFSWCDSILASKPCGRLANSAELHRLTACSLNRLMPLSSKPPSSYRSARTRRANTLPGLKVSMSAHDAAGSRWEKPS
eukprot:scaffold63174_cov76-Phaeocystis_antarctica.AAC.4